MVNDEFRCVKTCEKKTMENQPNIHFTQTCICLAMFKNDHFQEVVLDSHRVELNDSEGIDFKPGKQYIPSLKTYGPEFTIMNRTRLYIDTYLHICVPAYVYKCL